MGEKQFKSTQSIAWPVVIWQAGAHVAAVVVLSILLVAVVPRFGRSFQEFDLKLPAPTVLLINLSNFLVNRWFVGVPMLAVLLGCDIAILVALRTLSPSGATLSSIWSALVIVLLGGLVLLTIVSIVMPWMTLVQGLS